MWAGLARAGGYADGVDVEDSKSRDVGPERDGRGGASAGDRVRALDSVKREIAKKARRPWRQDVEMDLVNDLLPIIADELDRQDGLNFGAPLKAAHDNKTDNADATSGPSTNQVTWHLTTTGPGVIPVVEKIHGAFPSARTTMLRSDPPGHVVEARGTIEGWDAGAVTAPHGTSHQRVIEAPDGNWIVICQSKVLHGRSGPNWTWRCKVDGKVLVGPDYEEFPSDTAVLSDYQAWKSNGGTWVKRPLGERTVTAADGTRIEVISNRCGWVIRWPGETHLRISCPTDAEVLADYEAWKRNASHRSGL